MPPGCDTGILSEMQEHIMNVYIFVYYLEYHSHIAINAADFEFQL